jgi:hypothetical protein
LVRAVLLRQPVFHLRVLRRYSAQFRQRAVAVVMVLTAHQPPQTVAMVLVEVVVGMPEMAVQEPQTKVLRAVTQAHLAIITQLAVAAVQVPLVLRELLL